MEEAVCDFPEPDVLDWNRLPRRLRDNLHVVKKVQAAARDAYAVRYALHKIGDVLSSGLPEPHHLESWSCVYRNWQEAFGRAAHHWARFNKLEPQWLSGDWPLDAERSPDAKEVEQAISIMLGASTQPMT